VQQVLGEEAAPLTRLVELPGRGVTRVWECAGPPGAQTLMLIHGVACTAELNWRKVFAPLAAHFRVVAADLRGHGDGIRAGSRFRTGPTEPATASPERAGKQAVGQAGHSGGISDQVQGSEGQGEGHVHR
jgi:pimeloyl-ACP methyl ester carboxylesterase